MTGRSTLLCVSIGIFYCSIAIVRQTLGQTPLPLPKPTATAVATLGGPSPDPSGMILQYETFLSEEAKKHREYLQQSLEHLKWIITAVLGVSAVVFGWFTLTSRKEIISQANEYFRSRFDKQAEKYFAQLRETVGHAEKQISDIIKKTEGLTRRQLRLGELVEDLTYAFNVLSGETDAPEWKFAAKAAKERLTAHRGHFPELRGLGIVLGRLHKCFGEFDEAVDVLSSVMKARDKNGLTRDKNYADLLFNRACYRNRRAENLDAANNTDDAEALRMEAWEDINISVELSSGNKIEAIGNVEEKIPPDEDLVSLWNETTRTKQILGTLDFRSDKKRVCSNSLGDLIKGMFRRR